MDETLDPVSDRGQLALDAESVTYTRNREIVWALPLHRLRVIGEYTNDNGPAFDDYFIVFVAAHPFELVIAPVEAEGSLLADMSDRLRCALSHTLTHRTDFASRILWPPELRDRPLFDFRKVARRPSTLSRVKDWLVPLIALEPTAEVRRYTDA